jgi:hypothetical protein
LTSWYGYHAQLFGYDEAVRLETRDLFMKTDVFILTFGLSEVWYDEPTGEVFWKAVPKEHVDPLRHKFRVSTVQENRDNIRAIYDLIRKHRPDAKIVCTLSPIPLMATFRPVSTITANSVSKAILRAAVDEVCREVGHDGVLHYWPSYEIVMEGFGAHPYGGHFCLDRRHADEAVISYIMRLFERHYCTGVRQATSVLRAYAEARTSTGDLPAEVLASLEQGRRATQTQIEHYVQRDDQSTAELIERLAAEVYPAGPVEASSDWVSSEADWRALSDQSSLGPRPDSAPVPSVAWDYGSVGGPFKAEPDEDLYVQATVQASCPARLLMIRADGSQVGATEHLLSPEDGEVAVGFRLFGEDEAAYLLVRNAGVEGVGGTVSVRNVMTSRTPAMPPRRQSSQG